MTKEMFLVPLSDSANLESDGDYLVLFVYTASRITAQRAIQTVHFVSSGYGKYDIIKMVNLIGTALAKQDCKISEWHVGKGLTCLKIGG